MRIYKVDFMKASTVICSQTEIVAENGLVVAGHKLEAEAGLRILQQGGNAVDALVAAAFAGFVAEPSNCGVGGYARMSIFVAEQNKFVTIDGYVRAPGLARSDMFELDKSIPAPYYGHPHTIGRKAEHGFLACAVPGAVACLCAAHEMFGKLPRAQILEPAIEYARAGLPMDWQLSLTIADCMQDIQSLPDTAAFLVPGGRFPRIQTAFHSGERLDFSALARTLERISEQGHQGFYSGPVAKSIAHYVAANGGILSVPDLVQYRPKILYEMPANYRGFDYITANDPLGREVLNILENYDLQALGIDSVEYRHLVAEAFGHAFADNMMFYGDPDFTASPVNGLSSRAFGNSRTNQINRNKAASRPIGAGDPWQFEMVHTQPHGRAATPSFGGIKGTTQMAAADREGNLALTCTSLTGAFGSHIYVPEVGVFLNNAMQNYDPRPGYPNSILPGKMPIFAAPVLAMARDGRASFGSAGSMGYRILSGVIHSAIHSIDFGLGAQAGVDYPRVYCQGNETFVDGRIPAEVRAQLAEMGHQVVEQTDEPGKIYFGRVNTIVIDPKTGFMHSGASPAWSTAAAGF